MEVTRQVAALCATQDWALTAGVHADELQRALLVFELNAFSCHELFPSACRINHSCAHNLTLPRPTAEGARVFRACRTIEDGEELTLNYLGEGVWQGAWMRQRALWQTKMFECACELCTREGDRTRCTSCRHCEQEPASIIQL